MTAFEEALAYLFGNEGVVYTNDPSDSGGPTKFGITLKTFSDFVGRPVAPHEIEALTIKDIKPIYLRNYWQPLACPAIKERAISTALFDCGVLYGVFWATVFAQQTLKDCGASLVIDGVFGNQTLTGLNAIPANRFLRKLNLVVKDRIDSIVLQNPKNAKFKKGWTKRADRLLTLSSAHLS